MRGHLLSLLFVPALLVAVVQPAAALIMPRVSLSFDPTPNVVPSNGDEDRDVDSIDNSGGPIARNLFAAIPTPGNPPGSYAASGSVGVLGDLGVQGEVFTAGELRAQVIIESDEFINLSPQTRNATANFIIDGGFLSLLAGAGSELSLLLTIQRDFNTVWQSGVELLAGPSLSDPVTVTFLGEDIGATQTAPDPVELPLSVNSADLGPVGPNETFSVRYQLDILADIQLFSEFTQFAFSDPLSVSGFGDFPTVSLGGPGTGQLPSPATLPLLLAELAGLAARCRRS